MRISYLLNREPFGQILTNTLEQFWAHRYGCEYRIDWIPQQLNIEKPFKVGSSHGLGIYFKCDLCSEFRPETFRPIRAEFGYSLSLWRRPLQKLYVHLASSKPGALFFSRVGLNVKPAIDAAHQLMIVAGNHKIRVLDIANQESWA